MISMANCDWEVHIENNYEGRFKWYAVCDKDTGCELGCFVVDARHINAFVQLGFSKSRENAMNNWRKFANLNGFKNWNILMDEKKHGTGG